MTAKRYVLATLVGTASYIVSMAAGCIWTNTDYIEMAISYLVFYFAGWGITFWLSEPEKPKEQPQRTRWELQIYTLKEAEDERKAG